MKMKLAGFDLEIEMSCDKSNILIIEDHKLFAQTCLNLNYSYDDEIVFCENDTLIKTKDIIIINDVLNYDINNKTIITKLYKKVINDLLMDSDIEYDLRDKFNGIYKIIYDIIEEYNIDIAFDDEIDFMKYLKCIGLKIVNNYDKVIDKILDIVEVYSELCNQTMIFINVLSYFDDKEIKELLKYIKYKKLSVLFIENRYNDYVYFENKYMIDYDFDDYII